MAITARKEDVKVIDVISFFTYFYVQNIWSLRESCASALLKDGYNYKYDVSLPLDHFYTLAEEMRERVKNHAIRTVAYGHVGDGGYTSGV